MPDPQASARPLIVAVAGGSGSGKTTVAQAIYQAAGEANALVLSQDAYYRAQALVPKDPGHQGSGHQGFGHQDPGHQVPGHQVPGHQDPGHQGFAPEEARTVNYDEPAAFEHALLVAHLGTLARGEGVAQPRYDFTRDDRAPETRWLEPRRVVIVEGILILHDAELRALLDLAVFVDAPPDERFIRRLERDVRERGRSAEGVIAQYRQTVAPMHDLYVEPTKRFADLIIPKGGKNRLAIGVLQAWVLQACEARR